MMYLPHQRHSSIMRDRESLNQKEPWPFSFALRPFCSAKPAVVGRYLQCLLKSNMGVTVLPEITLGSILSDDIVCVPLSFPVLERTVNLAYDSRRHMSPACQLFLEFCKEYFHVNG